MRVLINQLLQKKQKLPQSTNIQRVSYILKKIFKIKIKSYSKVAVSFIKTFKKGLIYNFLKKMLSNKRIEVFNPKSLFNNVILQKDLNKIIYFLIMKKFSKKKKLLI